MIRCYWLVPLAWSFFTFGQSSADDRVIPASFDAAIQSSGALGLSVDDGASIQTSRSGGNNIRHGIYVFDLSSVPENATIAAAEFRVTTAALISNTGATAMVDFHGFAGDASITEADFDTPASTVDSLLVSENFPAGAGASPGVGSVLGIGVTNLDPIQAIVDDPSSDFLMIRSETVNFVTFRVDSLENTVGSGVPTLVLTT